MRVWAALLAVFTAAGFGALLDLLSTPWRQVALVAGLALIAARVRFPAVARPLGLVVVPVFALLGFNFLWSYVDPVHPPPLAGLVMAALFVGWAVGVYLHPWWVVRASAHPRRWALGVVAVLVVAPPAVVAALRAAEDEPPLPAAQPVSRLDAVLLGPAPPEEAVVGARGWSVHVRTGRLEQRRLAWTAGVPPVFRDGADRVVVVAPDGLPDQPGEAAWRSGEVGRWLTALRGAIDPALPRFVVLDGRDPVRFERWRRRFGDDSVVSLHDLPRGRAPAELALSLAAAAPEAEQDLALAVRHRPALLFDSAERYPKPLDVDGVLSSGTLRLCPDHQPVLALCTEIGSSEDLFNGGAHLAFTTRAVVAADIPSRIYVHVVRRGGLVHLDYWWYFPDNPTKAANGALCGAGFVIAEITCFDHQSDWEGVTVAVRPGEPSEPVHAQYAQHNGVTRYTWPALRARWLAPSMARFATTVDLEARPLVFVAAGTHASYPTACGTARCREADTALTEARHNGRKRWPANEDETCAATCVEALPTRDRGRTPARWNAFDGKWGTTDCDLFFCTSTDAPRSPSTQGRYVTPECANRTVDLVDGRIVVRRGRDCGQPPRA